MITSPNPVFYRFLLLLCLFCSSSRFCPAQTWALAQANATHEGKIQDNNNPSSVLNEMRVRYNVEFVYAPKNVEGKIVTANIEFTEEVEKVLDRILPAFNLKYKKVKDKTYVIS